MKFLNLMFPNLEFYQVHLNDGLNEACFKVYHNDHQSSIGDYYQVFWGEDLSAMLETGFYLHSPKQEDRLQEKESMVAGWVVFMPAEMGIERRE